MALSAGDKTTVLSLRNKYFKALPADGTEADWPVDAAGTPYASDATTPADAGGGDPGAADLASGHKAKIASLTEGLQVDLNTQLDLIVTLGGA